MGLNGKEFFYDDWRSLVLSAVGKAPVLDLGTSEPYRKEMAMLRGNIAEPYICLDVRPSPTIDLVGDGQKLPLKTASVGSIICSHVLEHTPRPDQVIDEMYRVLVPGGGAYMTFLDMHPYHREVGVVSDYHRFKRDAIPLLLERWSRYEVLSGGGLGYVAFNFAPNNIRPFVQRVANVVDQRRPTTATDVFYVAAFK